MTSKATTIFNQLQLRPLMCDGKPTAPFSMSGLAEKLVDMSVDLIECQWLHQRLSLAVVRGNTANILACVQVLSDIICSFFC